MGESIANIKEGTYRIGEVIDLGENLTQQARKAWGLCHHQPDFPLVDDFLIRIRTAFLSS